MARFALSATIGGSGGGDGEQQQQQTQQPQLDDADGDVQKDGSAAVEDAKARPPNLLFLMLDQLRFDTLGYMQNLLERYDGKLKINTPNIDRLAASGVICKSKRRLKVDSIFTEILGVLVQ